MGSVLEALARAEETNQTPPDMGCEALETPPRRT